MAWLGLTHTPLLFQASRPSELLPLDILSNTTSHRESSTHRNPFAISQHHIEQQHGYYKDAKEGYEGCGEGSENVQYQGTCRRPSLICHIAACTKQDTPFCLRV
jgi:hypothetical protein